MKSLLASLKAFLGPVSGSYRGVLVPEELNRAILASLGGSGALGVLIALITAVAADSSKIFPNSAEASAAAFGLGLLVDLLRRVDQGKDAPPGPVAPLKIHEPTATSPE